MWGLGQFGGEPTDKCIVAGRAVLRGRGWVGLAKEGNPMVRAISWRGSKKHVAQQVFCHTVLDSCLT